MAEQLPLTPASLHRTPLPPGEALFVEIQARPSPAVQTMKPPILLSIIIPAYNEQTTVEKIYRVDLSQFGIQKEIIVVDDGSMDTTSDVLRQIRKSENGSDITRSSFDRLNLGKETTLCAGLQCARGQIILIQDADLEYDPADYPQIVEPIVTGRTQVVFGSRFRYVDRWGGANMPTTVCRLRPNAVRAKGKNAL